MPSSHDDQQHKNAQTTNKNTITVSCDEDAFAPTRLDRYLFQRFPEYSRAYFQDLIDRKKVSVNGIITTKSSLPLKKNDTIAIVFTQKETFVGITPLDIPFEIVDIQDDFIVINKPAGLVVHASTHNKNEPSLVHGLLYRFQEFAHFSQNDRPGIVHRLDKNTSGLMIVARNEQALMNIAALFKQRKIGKTYLAIVHGTPAPQGKIEYPIGRHPHKSYKMSHMGFHSKPALTLYNRLAVYKNSALVAANLITGRTHQIRVHFSAIGHGLIGDEVYGRNSPLLKRQALHSWKLAFTYKGISYSYTKHLPDDMIELIKNLNPHYEH